MADAPPKKKLPFKPTALRSAAPAATQASSKDAEDDGDGLDLFRRSKEMAPMVAAEQLRRWKRKQRRMAEEKEERRRSSGASKRSLEEDGGNDEEVDVATGSLDDVVNGNDDDEDLYTAPSTQRAGPATDEEAGALDLATPPPSKRTRLATSASSSKHGANTSATHSVTNSPSTRTLRSRAAAQTATPSASIPTATEIITLDDSDSEPEVQLAPPPPRSELVEEDPLLLNDAPSDDDEFAEYVRRAEEQRAAAAAAGLQASPSLLPTETPPPKEIVEIIITSDLPGSKPCCIKFLFDRPLRLVRDSWIALQRKHGIPLPLEQDDDAVLTWRRKRVYMFSTLLNLGIRPKGDGTVVVEGGTGYSRDGLAEARTRVHMEAWTPALFAQMERDEELRRRREAGELSDDDDEDGAGSGDGEHGGGAAGGDGGGGGGEVEEAVKLRVILKPRDLEPVKLLVRPETTVDTLVTAFCTQRDVPEGADVGLWFDGMRMEEDATMEDADIDDMDTIEVHIK